MLGSIIAIFVEILANDRVQPFSFKWYGLWEGYVFL